MVKSNVFYEQDCLNTENEVLAAKIAAVYKSISILFYLMIYFFI